MKSKLAIFLIAIFFVYSNNLVAQNMGIALKASTLGVGLEVARSFSPNFNVKLGGAYFTYSLSGENDKKDIKYEATANLTSISILADWFPFGGAFRLTGGLLINMNEGELDLTPLKTYSYGEVTYTPTDLGKVDGKVSFNKVAPYLGFGVGNITAGSGLGFTFDVGGVYQGKPVVDLKATDLLKPTEGEGEKIEKNLEWFQFFPVISFGISYTF